MRQRLWDLVLTVAVVLTVSGLVLVAHSQWDTPLPSIPFAVIVISVVVAFGPVSLLMARERLNK